MSALSDKVSYLKGLAEGMKIDIGANEGKLLMEIIEALNLVSEKVEALDEGFEELSDYVECIDEDLEELEMCHEEEEDEDDDEDEEDFHDDYDFDEEDFDEDEEDSQCDDQDEEDEEHLGMYAGCLCSECGGMFSVDVNAGEDQLFICPHCGKRVKAIQMNCQNVPVAQSSQDEDKE